MNEIKILDKVPKLKKSSLSLHFLKDYLKSIKEICKEIGSEFKQKLLEAATRGVL